MSTDGDKYTACPNLSDTVSSDSSAGVDTISGKHEKNVRKVSFADDQDKLVTQYFEPADPWQNVLPTTHEQLLAEYLQSCERHGTEPIQSVVQHIQELPACALSGSGRAPRLCLADCSLRGAAPADALEALLSRVQFRRVELHAEAIDDVAAEALFDMIEYYESANIVNITGSKDFGIIGWQACSRMIRKSVSLAELEARDTPLEAAHAPVLARALRPHACRLRALTLVRARLAGDPLTCLVTMLKVNGSVRELKLADNQLTGGDAKQLASLLKLNTRIQLLDLSNNCIQDAGVEHLAEALVAQAAHTPPSPASSPLSPHHCPISGYESRGLAFLVLWNNLLTRNCARHLTKALKTSHSLCVLNVGRNALGSELVRSLSCEEAGAVALASLGLQATRLGADAARALPALLRVAPALQRLDLRDNGLGAAGLRAVRGALRGGCGLLQVDLDDAGTEESPSLLSVSGSVAGVAGAADEGEADECARLTREIRALCRANESALADQRPPHRKISLTCHTAHTPHRTSPPQEEARRAAGRLRSPAPSPAGSPIPPQHSRFSVTRVTPDREPASERGAPATPVRPSSCPTPSRFKVVQVDEPSPPPPPPPPPPQIEVQVATPEAPRRASRFSVSRIYDPPRSAPIDKSSAAKSDTDIPKSDKEPTKRDKSEAKPNTTDDKEVKKSDSSTKSDPSDNDTANYRDKSEELSHNVSLNQEGDDTVVVSETKLVKSSKEMSDSEKVDVNVEVTVKKETLAGDNDIDSDKDNVNSVNETPAKVHADQNTVSMVLDDNASVDNDIDNFRNIDDIAIRKPSDNTLRKIEAITEDLGHLIQEMGDLSTKTHSILMKRTETIEQIIVKNDSTQTETVTNEQICAGVTTVTKDDISVPVSLVRDSVVLKKNKSESSLDSPDLEVSRLMNKRNAATAFCDSNSSFSGSSMESLNNPDVHSVSRVVVSIPDSVQSDTELDRRKADAPLSTGSSLDSNTSELTPVNCGAYLNTSVSSNESVSPIIFGRNVKIHGSLSSLEASVSSLDSARGVVHEKVMVASADSGIEYSLQNPSDARDECSSNEGTLTHNYIVKESIIVRNDPQNPQDTLTSSPKRTTSLLDVPASRSKGIERVRKISWVAPSPSFHIPKQEPEPPKQESKLPLHLEKLLSLFQHPSTIFSRSATDDERRSASNTPPRKESTSLTSSFWSWGGTSSTEKIEKDDKIVVLEDRDSSPENTTDSTLSERVQVSFVDESFSKKLDSKTPSTDTDNTLSEFQSLPNVCTSETSDVSQQECLDAGKSERSDDSKQTVVSEYVKSDDASADTSVSTENNIVQKQLDLSLENTNFTGVRQTPANCDIEKEDLIDEYENPNDFNRNLYDTHGTPSGDNRNTGHHCDNASKKPDAASVDKDNNTDSFKVDAKINLDVVRPHSFAAVLKSSSGNSLDNQISPDTGQSIDKLPNKVIRGIKENISPENTLTSSMSNTKALAQELAERETKDISPECNEQVVNAIWEVTIPALEKNGTTNTKVQSKNETEAKRETLKCCDDSLTDVNLDSEIKEPCEASNSDKNVSIDSGVALDERGKCPDKYNESIDLGKDALALLVYENQDFEPDADHITDVDAENRRSEAGTDLAEELRDAELQQLIDLSPELVVDEAIEAPEVFTTKEMKGLRSSPVIPERAKLKKSNSLEELSERLQRIDDDDGAARRSKIVFKVSEVGSTPKDIPESRRHRLRTRSGSSPKSLPETFVKSPMSKHDPSKKKKKVSSLGKIARDSLLALNMSEEEIAEFRRSYKLTSVESLRSLESVSEDANSQSGNSLDSRCRVCLRTSQESLMSLDSISEDCRCGNSQVCGETSHSAL